jgi:GxxExxY protein
MIENQITQRILECAYKIHTALGPGLLESAYERCLYHELKKIGLQVDSQVALPLVYEGVHLECGYRLDLVVENKIIIEVKSVEAISDLHLAQVLTYLRLRDSRLGLLINFNVLHLKEGIKRIANRFVDT